MMTSFAFIAGLYPLVVAQGAAMLSRRGVEYCRVRRHDRGLAVGIFLIPTLYVVFQWLREKVRGVAAAQPRGAVGQAPPGCDPAAYGGRV